MDYNPINVNSPNSKVAKIGWQQLLSTTCYDFGYINSYLEVANTLIESKYFVPDLYVFPVIFCYRQFIELSLKNICKLKMQETAYIQFIRNASHNLQKIWQEAEKHLIEFNITEQDQIDFLKKVVDDFDMIDPTSFDFRYPQDKQLNNSLQNSITHNADGTITEMTINISNVYKNINNYDLIIHHTYDFV